MNWLKDNPIALALASFGGVLVLLALVMAIVWSMPVSVATGETVTDESDRSGGVVVARQVSEMSELQADGGSVDPEGVRPLNWTNVGDLQHVNADLRQIAAFIRNEDPDD